VFIRHHIRQPCEPKGAASGHPSLLGDSTGERPASRTVAFRVPCREYTDPKREGCQEEFSGFGSVPRARGYGPYDQGLGKEARKRIS
jgi:hypothetical protein